MLNFQDNYPLSKITTLQIGGPAKKLVVVRAIEELIKAVKYAKDQAMPYLVVGGGSNLLVSDEGFAGLVIKNEINGISTSKVGSDSFEVRAKSGTSLQELVDYTISHGLLGLEKLTKIPGTVGGAVYGNAGAYGETISDCLTEVTVIDPSVIPAKAGIHTNNIYGSHCPEDTHSIKSGMTKEDCHFGYRDSIFKKNRNIVLEVKFKLQKGDAKDLDATAKEITWKRFVKYPPALKCPGSFFKNLVAAEISPEVLENIPEEKIVYGKIPAAVLLEAVGAKGQSLDGIEFSPNHANLIINKGEGNAKAFYTLAKIYVQKVKDKFGITLEPEVQFINLPSL